VCGALFWEARHIRTDTTRKRSRTSGKKALLLVEVSPAPPAFLLLLALAAGSLGSALCPSRALANYVVDGIARHPAPVVAGNAAARPSGAPIAKRKLRQSLYVHSAIVIVPSFFLGRFFRSYSNALCRRHVGSVARRMGTNRANACNFRLGLGYQHTQGRLVLRGGLEHTRLHMPDSNWLGKRERISAADLTQIRLHLTALRVGALFEFPLARGLSSRRRRHLDVSWRVGGNVGLGFLGGGIYRTKLGSQTSQCTLRGLGDLSVCRPYRPLEFNEAGRSTPYFAHCESGHCNEADLIRAGRTRQRGLPSVVPIANLVTGPRFEMGRLGLALEMSVGVGIGLGIALDTRLKTTH